MSLSIQNLSLTIDNKKLLDDISFDAQQGTMTYIGGRNGSGKSLLLKSIKGIEKPAGKILLDGKELNRKERMKRFGLVFQDTSLEIVGSTVERDIAFGPENQGKHKKEIEEIVDSSLRYFELEDKRKARPEILSGGEKRRLTIAGVIAMESSIILLDEPFANLDYPSTLSVLKSLIKLREDGYTLLIVSHEAEKFLFHTDCTIVMDRGRIVGIGESRNMLDILRKYDIYVPKNASFEDLTWLR